MPVRDAVVKQARRPRGNGGGKGIAIARERGINTSNKAGAALVPADKPLSELQKQFVHHWARGETILSAAVKAGYTDGGTFAYRMVHMPNVLAAYNEEKAAYERDSGMSRATVIAGFQEAIEMAKLLGEPASMIAGWREVGRMCGYYEPVQVNHKITHEGKLMVDRLDKLTDAELFELIQQQAAAMAAGAATPQGILHDEHDEAGAPA